MFTTIIHPLRKIYNLSLIEYCILEEIRVLSHADNQFGGWCIKAKENIAKNLDIGYATVFRALNTLEEKELIERSHTGVRCLNEWLKAISKREFEAFSNGDTASIKMIPTQYQNDTHDSIKMIHKNNIVDKHTDLNNISIGISEIPEIIKLWNRVTAPTQNFRNKNIHQGHEIFQKCRKETLELQNIIKIILKDHSMEDIKHSMRQYAIEILDRDPEQDYSRHRFSLYDFLKQKNGFIKFLNQNK